MYEGDDGSVVERDEFTEAGDGLPSYGQVLLCALIFRHKSVPKRTTRKSNTVGSY